ncbi:putative gamma interferon inducible lysosomal thiol reductase [Erysiphe neolycopersici]|uniref:Putative gamma interferon inducible lysosomal thiol reductase n=1 Tax=Erysiphe neolycopersici TaxID=212602 RepID=A0A420H8Y3_9PEZI|nr:putative gamma interferon inducible lysosomal thiol reductase [Erysiphe neolycopersici]
MEKTSLSIYNTSLKSESEHFEKSVPKQGCRYWFLAITFVFITILNYLVWPIYFRPIGLSKFDHRNSRIRPLSVTGSSTHENLVPLEAHIMSKCPDAQDCLELMIIPTMERISEKINFTLSYIGEPIGNDGIHCMHGPEECIGNIVELCAAKVYPDPQIYLGFTMCLTKEYKEIPDRSLLEECALEHGIDFKKLNECASKDNGHYGLELLRQSARHSKEVGVTKSCTVRLNEEIYCVRDGREWTECPHGPAVEDLVNAVEGLYQKSLP